MTLRVVKVGTSLLRERPEASTAEAISRFPPAWLNASPGETALFSSHPGPSGWAANGWAWSVAP